MAESPKTPDTEQPAIVAEPEPLTDEQVEDFDAFWTSPEADRKTRPVRIMGEIVHLPPALPLAFEMEAKRLQRSKRDQDVQRLLSIIFPEDALERWTERGMDAEQFKVLLAWAPRYISGQKITLAEVLREVREHEAAEAAKEAAKAAGANPTRRRTRKN